MDLLNINVRVRAFMSTKMYGVEMGTTVKDAVKKMVDEEIGSLLVTKEKRPVGIITERDILRRVVHAGLNTSKQVEEVMSSPLITIGPIATLGDAAELMVQNKIRRLLVKEDDKIVGIVTQRDLQRALMETFSTLLLT